MDDIRNKMALTIAKLYVVRADLLNRGLSTNQIDDAIQTARVVATLLGFHRNHLNLIATKYLEIIAGTLRLGNFNEVVLT